MPHIIKGHPGHEGAKVWNQVWQTDRYAKRTERLRRAQRRFGLVKNTFAPSAGEAILDLGCGTGDFLNLLHDTYPNINLTGADFSKAAIVKAKKALDNSVALVCADALRLPYIDDSFDNIFCFGVLEHIVAAKDALTELSRILKPAGSVYLSLSSAHSFQQIYNYVMRRFRPYPYGYQKNSTQKELQEILPATLQIKKMQSVHADWDQPHILMPDFLVSMVIREWSRYIFVKLEKV